MPFGPWPGVSSGGSDTIDLANTLSFGHGIPDEDDNLPEPEGEEPAVFWLSPTTNADIATVNQVREWPAGTALSHLGMVGQVDRVDLTGGDIFIEITVDGVGTGILATLSDGETGRFTVDDDFLVPANSDVGVAVIAPFGVSGNLRMQVRLVGLPDSTTGIYRVPSLTLNQWSDGSTGVLGTNELGEVTSWPNAGSSGAAIDAVPCPDMPRPLLTVDDDGFDVVRFRFGGPFAGQMDGLQSASNDGTLMDAPGGGLLADQHSFHLVRINTLPGFAYDAGIRYRATPFGGGNFSVNENFPANVAAPVWEQYPSGGAVITASPGVSFLAQKVILEFRVVAGVLTVLVNGQTLPTNTNVPTVGISPTGYIYGIKNDGGDGQDADHFVHMFYKEAIPMGGAAKTRQAIADAYGVVLP